MSQLPLFQASNGLSFKPDLFPSTYACSTSFQHSFSEDLHNTSYETNCSDPTRMMFESKASKKLKKDNLGDRFIPMRNSRRMEVGSYMLSSQEGSMCEEEDSYSKLITEGLIKAPLENDENRDPRINQYRQQSNVQAPSALHNQLSFIYDKAFKNNEGTKKTSRIVNQNPEKVLDAPELINDYYLNLLDWGNNNVLAICLNQVVYLWNSSNSEIEQLQPVNEADSYVSSVSWSTNSNVIAIGTSSNTVQIWDAERSQLIRTLEGHTQRVSSLSWNNCILSSGSRDSSIINHDLRMHDHILQRHTLHSSEVCALKWSPDGSQLASGANDNTVMIWDLVSNSPQHVLREHTAAVKALAWCPWQKNLLASGGGTNDKTIKFWNTDAGTMTQSVNANTQVCSLIWNPHEKEILSSHGFTNVAEGDSKSYIQLWKYPTMNVVGELRGHDDRVLHLALSPNGETVVSAGADERLCFWKMFEAPQVDKKSVKSQMFTSEFR